MGATVGLTAVAGTGRSPLRRFTCCVGDRFVDMGVVREAYGGQFEPKGGCQ